jgi:hypothetical protein
MARTSPAVRARGSSRATLWSRIAALTASSMFWLSLEAAPSVPSPTGIPAWRSAGTGQTPEPRIMLATGLWTTVAPELARVTISSGCTQMQWAASSGTSSSPTIWPRSARPEPGARPARPPAAGVGGVLGAEGDHPAQPHRLQPVDRPQAGQRALVGVAEHVVDAGDPRQQQLGALSMAPTLAISRVRCRPAGVMIAASHSSRLSSSPMPHSSPSDRWGGR